MKLTPGEDQVVVRRFRMCLAYSGLFVLCPALPASAQLVDESSPFGVHPAHIYFQGYPESGHIDAWNIGVRWTRIDAYITWARVQPDLGDPTYHFEQYDSLLGQVPSNIGLVVNIGPEQGGSDPSRRAPGSYLPSDTVAYARFVRAAIERYDGDGVGEEDFPGGVFPNPVRYWQVDNEPSACRWTDFADLQRITYTAIKLASPEAKVLIGGSTGQPWGYVYYFNNCYLPILQELAGQYVDIMDMHWYGLATGDYRFVDPENDENALATIRSGLVASGFPADFPIWITEMGVYSGNPLDIPDPPGPATYSLQSERDQAVDLFKRYVYSISQGIDRVFMAFGLIEGLRLDNGYFDHTGLIYDGQQFGQGSDPAVGGDPGLGVKKLSYYTYEKMTMELGDVDWSTLQILHDGTLSDHLYLFRVMDHGLPVYVTWWDYFDDAMYVPGATKNVTIEGLQTMFVTSVEVVPNANLGRDVTDSEVAFPSTLHLVLNGEITIALGTGPIIARPDTAVTPVPLSWVSAVVIALLLTVLAARALKHNLG